MNSTTEDVRSYFNGRLMTRVAHESNIKLFKNSYNIHTQESKPRTDDVWVDDLRPSQQFFSHARTELGITSTFWEVNVSCSRIQHGDPSEDRTPDLSLRSPTLYH